MHNWLIFQYHRVRAHPNPRGTAGLTFGSSRWNLVREAKGGRRRIGEPRRWLSWGKRVGGVPGKSGTRTP